MRTRRVRKPNRKGGGDVSKEVELGNAIISEEEADVKRLISEGTDLNAKNNYNPNALSTAVLTGNVIIIKLLIDAGATASQGEIYSALKEYSQNRYMASIVTPKQILELVGITKHRFIDNAVKIPGFEVRTFENSMTEAIPVYVTTLKKGTILFRGLLSLKQLQVDMLGVQKITGDEYCLSPHHNVFFYPFPFADSTVGSYNSMVVYRVTTDIKIASYILPTPMARADRSIHNMPIQACSTLKPSEIGCELEGKKYDPCFNHRFLRENPDVVGFIGIAGTDRQTFIDIVEGGELPYDGNISPYVNKFVSGYLDSHSIVPGIPEIVLYPRNKRLTEQSKTPANVDFVKWLVDNDDSLSISPYHVIEKRDDETIEEFMTKMVSPTGMDGIGSFQIDKTTGFFVDPAFVEDKTHLLPPKEFGRMAESFPELIFTRAKFLLSTSSS